jgi:uroporphyrinogen decarboxylase
LTSRERVRKAIIHEEPDRVPIDCNSVVSQIHEKAYENLLDYLGLQDEIRIVCPTQRIAGLSEEVYELLGVDTRYIYANAPSFWKYEERSDGSWVDEFGTGFKRCGLYCDISEPVLANATLEDVKRYQFPDPRDPARFEGLREKSENLYKNTGYALVGGLQLAIYYFAWVLRGIRQFTEDIILNKPLADYIMDKLVDWNIEMLDGYLSEVGDCIEYQWFADDWGVQDGPFISPEMFRETMAPRFKKIISFVKSKTKAKFCLHTCGATYWMMDDLVKMGVDIVHPVQANAKDNKDAARLKREYGDKLVFHGNTNNQGVFHKSIEEVTADALYRIRHLAPGGGYIFSGGHNIQVNMPPENIMALFNTAKEYGVYPIDTKRIDEKLKELSEIKPEIKEEIMI